MTEINIPSLKEFFPTLREKATRKLTVKEIIKILNKLSINEKYKVREAFRMETTLYFNLTDDKKEELIVVHDSMFTTIQLIESNYVIKTTMKAGANVF